MKKKKDSPLFLPDTCVTRMAIVILAQMTRIAARTILVPIR